MAQHWGAPRTVTPFNSVASIAAYDEAGIFRNRYPAVS